MGKNYVPLIIVDESIKIIKGFFWLCSLCGRGVKGNVFHCAKECSSDGESVRVLKYSLNTSAYQK